MKQVVSILLIVMLMAQSFTKLGIGLYYHINKSYIAHELCVNRNDPSKHCNGHCYLSKQLKKAEDQESKSQGQIVKANDEVLACRKLQKVEVYMPVYRTVGYLPSHTPFYHKGYGLSPVKPPAA